MTATKILVVDDEIELERLFKQRFRKKIKSETLEFVFALNGVEALEKIKTDTQFDVVITDINMPIMDGLTFLKELPSVDDTIRAIVLSAYGDLANIRTAMNRGAFDFLTKPIDFQDLAITIDKTVSFVQKDREQKDKLQQAISALKYQAFFDQLTNLPNQNRLVKEIHEAIQRSQKEDYKFAVLFMNVDCFKVVKYGLGPSYSDELLIKVAQRLDAFLPPKETIARVGTDEFAILLNDLANFSDAELAAHELLQHLQTPFQLDDSIITVQSFMGLVDNQVKYKKPEDYLRAAEIAMNSTKEEGIDSISLFQPSMQKGCCTTITN